MTTRTTFRIPSSLNDQLLFVSEHIGLAETTIMRTSITDELYSIKGPVPTKLVLNLDQDKVRKTVNLNEFVNGILQHAKDVTGQPANDLFAWALLQKLRYYQDILEELS
ncbi:hypothetical protein ACW2AE_03665 [Limosilactobacillus fermentum]|jgi:hypothetical protein|uniref:hypothetical protein n=1 Tax=Limosilactobacillus TaxID=2742598 RepID=UPI0021A5F631|nr:hypothetical protein [Limosilactobacillus fermentum]MCT3437594.1 hypothetical protein [Limosilactobacillus fermentum]MCT3440467.1 hypothetical protein [Limosilactobacillus fermentum]MCT3450930.1 hypothetical protein [Limosilactobacillus fermentum]MDH5017394.1 hypothetical protein [Limosilactobacillus fermentum]MDU2967618.1 hypothetical protein [Limosilactobacillus fermentum]